MGTARSGTTILEILLGSNASMLGVGELTHIFEHGFVENATCSCGEPFDACGFWASVQQRCGWSRQESREISDAVRRIERHGRFPLTAARIYRASLLRRWAEAHHRLVRAIDATASPAVVVDSSQYASRALLLSRTFPGRVRVICLTRRPSGLMAAFGKPNLGEQRPKSALAALAYYSYVITCARTASWLLKDRVLHVTFEALRTDPEGTLKRISDWSGYDVGMARETLVVNGEFTVGHIVTGNRLRKQGRVRFSRNPSDEAVRGLGRRVAVIAMDLYRRLLQF